MACHTLKGLILVTFEEGLNVQILLKCKNRMNEPISNTEILSKNKSYFYIKKFKFFFIFKSFQVSKYLEVRNDFGK